MRSAEEMTWRLTRTARTGPQCLVDPVIYGDVFDFPITLDELHRYSPQSIEPAELRERIREDNTFCRIVASRDDLYFLRGREELVELRAERREASKEAWRLARRVVGFIRYVPFIEGILVTGSVAVDNARRKDDIDFLVITSAGRLWSVFAVLGVLQRIFSRRFLCPNYYLTLDHLHLARVSYYVAREAVQARPLYGAAVCESFRECNNWITSFFPNAATAQEPPGGVLERRGFLGGMIGAIEWALGGWLGDRLERLLQRLLKRRLVAHYGKHGQEVPDEVLRNALEEVELRFHGLNYEESIYAAIQAREQQLAPLLKSDS